MRKLIESFYADDFVGGGGTPDNVKILYGKTCTQMQQGEFKLRKWLTNDDSVRAKIQTASVVKEIERPISEEDDSYAKLSLYMPRGARVKRY